MVSTSLDVQQLAMLASLFVPLLVSLISKKTASDAVKAVVNIIASALVSVLAIWINPSGQTVTVWLVINTFLAAIAASFVSYKAVWKPIGTTDSVATKTANFGIGSTPPGKHAADVEAEVIAPDSGEKDYSTQEDIGEITDLDGDGIPDELEVGDLDSLIASTSTDTVSVESEEVK